jgi:ketosteroid isomerase-like protein
MANESDTVSPIREAYDRLMRAFAGADTDEYFDCFHTDASFVFPGEPVMDSRDAYRTAWLQWPADGGSAGWSASCGPRP